MLRETTESTVEEKVEDGDEGEEGEEMEEEQLKDTETVELTKEKEEEDLLSSKHTEETAETETATLLTVLQVMLFTYPLRTLLGIVLMSTQAFFYNSIFFSYPLVLSRDYGVNDDAVGLYLIPYVRSVKHMYKTTHLSYRFAVTNFLGPVLLGGLFDTYGRRRMITLTYCLSGVLLIATSVLYRVHLLRAW